MSDTLALENAAGMDLVEAPQGQDVTTYDPGQLEAETPTAGLTIEEAADLYDDDSTDLVSADEKPIVVLNGHPIILSHLVRGYLAGAALQGAVTDLDARYAQITETAHSLLRGANAFASYVADNLPAQPPISLSYSDPEDYVRQSAACDQAHDIAERVMTLAKALDQRSRDQVVGLMQQKLMVEAKLLRQRFPETSTPKGLERFTDRLHSAMYEAGFTADDLTKVIDHRFFVLANLAAKGLEADQRKPPRPSQRAPVRRRSDAMERLKQSGSFDDAMKVDF